MIINFVLPGNEDVVIGGYKLVYQYANKLVDKGNEVHITYVERLFKSPYVPKFKRKVILLRNKLIKRGKSSVTWFKLDGRIKMHYNCISIQDIVNADAVIATAAPTANWVFDLSSDKGNKFYFIQNLENWWFNDDKDLYNTYKLGLNNIVISKDLERIVRKYSGKTPAYVPNFVDTSEFYLKYPVNNRENVVSLLNHVQITKRTKFGLEILDEVRKKVPDLQVELFGAYKPIQELPSYVHFTYKADVNDLREIYGKSKIYLLPSVLEGWGLTGMEAIASGAVLVASNVAGIMEYANENNSKLIEPYRKQEFVDVIVELLNSESARNILAEKALKDIRNYDISASTKRFENVIIEGCG